MAGPGGCLIRVWRGSGGAPLPLRLDTPAPCRRIVVAPGELKTSVLKGVFGAGLDTWERCRRIVAAPRWAEITGSSGGQTAI
jgi:hypothetical protein